VNTLGICLECICSLHTATLSLSLTQTCSYFVSYPSFQHARSEGAGSEWIFFHNFISSISCSIWHSVKKNDYVSDKVLHGILIGKTLKAFHWIQEGESRHHWFVHCSGSIATAIRQENEIWNLKIGKEEVKIINW
jgi:hypothetical protein